MSSRPSPRTLQATADGALPFESYAQLLHLYLPSLKKVCFYDEGVRVQWISDGVEEPDLRARAHRVLARPSEFMNEPAKIDDAGRAIHVAPVLGPDGSSRGAIVLVLDPTSGAHSSVPGPQELESALAPLLRILGHDWRESATSAAPQHPARLRAPRTSREPIVGPAARATASPVLLRRALAKAVDSTPCAFGALVATSRQMTLTQRVTASESQTEMREIVESLSAPMFHLVRTQREPVVVSRSDPLWVRTWDYKFLVCPLRTEDDRLAAMLVLFRRRRDRDFDEADCACLLEIAAWIPDHVLDELAPDEPDAGPAHAKSRRSANSIIEAASPENAEQLMERRIRTALSRDGFDLHAQRIAPLRETSQRARYEVLLRMRNDDALQSPAMFFGAAATYGLLPNLDRWVIGQLLKTVSDRGASMGDAEWEFALNVTAPSLLRETFGVFIESQLSRSAVPPQVLVFEFSERDVLEHRRAFEQLAPRLDALGCRIALDNCRRGLDIFASIARLPVHRLKIDAALTQLVSVDERAARTVGELVEVASDIGIETVGERIEDEATCQKLKELGVDFAQGFHLGKPQPLIELLMCS